MIRRADPAGFVEHHLPSGLWHRGQEIQDERTGGGAVLLEVGVPGPGNHVQPGAGDTVREQRGVGGGVEEVVGAVHDEGGVR